MNLLTKQKQISRLPEGVYSCRGGRGWRMRGRDSWGVGDEHVHTAIFRTDDQQVLPYSTWNLLIVMWQPGWEGSSWTHVYMAESLHCSLESITTLFVNWLYLSTTEQLHFHFSLSCIGEGNGNPLQCSFLENSRDWGAWWAAVYGVSQSRTQLM